MTLNLTKGREYSRQHDASLTLVCAGVLVASSADLDFNIAGLTTALFASVFTASNVVLGNDRTKKLDPFEALNVMAPYSIAMLLPIWYATD